MQGTVLCPVLLLVLIADITKKKTFFFNISNFAEDTIASYIISPAGSHNLQYALNIISYWAQGKHGVHPQQIINMFAITQKSTSALIMYIFSIIIHVMFYLIS